MVGREIAEYWLATTITDLGYDVYRHPAPLNAAYPHVTIALRQGTDVRSVGGQSKIERLTYDISAWNEGSNAAPLFAMNAAIHDALDNISPQAVPDMGIINSCIRIGAVPITTIVENGVLYQRDGYLWELYTITN